MYFIHVDELDFYAKLLRVKILSIQVSAIFCSDSAAQRADSLYNIGHNLFGNCVLFMLINLSSLQQKVPGTAGDRFIPDLNLCMR